MTQATELPNGMPLVIQEFDESNDHYADIQINMEKKKYAYENNLPHTSNIVFQYIDTLNLKMGTRDATEEDPLIKWKEQQIRKAKLKNAQMKYAQYMKLQNENNSNIEPLLVLHKQKRVPNINGNQETKENEHVENLPKNGVVRKHPLSDGFPILTKYESRYPLSYKFAKTESRLVRSMFERHGFVENNSGGWNILWTGNHPKPFVFQYLEEYQKINHFPRSYELTRKSCMYKNIIRMQTLYGKEHFDFVPRTYCLPEDLELFKKESKENPGIFIIKPVALSRGRGIRLITSAEEVMETDETVICEYIKNPYLIDGKKFDLRIYCVVTSYDPLRIYVYEEGLTRFASEEYNLNDIDNIYSHLTNYSVNRKSKKFVNPKDANSGDSSSKWTLTKLKKYLEEKGIIDSKTLTERIHDVIIKSIIAGEAVINPAVHAHVPYRENCFELFGFDILLDEHLKPYLLEINLTPSLSCTSPLDHQVKTNLMVDTFNMIRIQAYDREAYKEYKRSKQFNPYRRINHQRLTKKEKEIYEKTKDAITESLSKFEKEEPYKHIDFSGLTIQEKLMIKETIDENALKGKFIRVFPAEDSEKYLPFIEYNDNNRIILRRLFGKNV